MLSVANKYKESDVRHSRTKDCVMLIEFHVRYHADSIIMIIIQSLQLWTTSCSMCKASVVSITNEGCKIVTVCCILDSMWQRSRFDCKELVISAETHQRTGRSTMKILTINQLECIMVLCTSSSAKGCCPQIQLKYAKALVTISSS